MLACPIPIDRYPFITLAHGGGGRLMQQLISDMIAPLFPNATAHDAALLDVQGQLAMTTDSFVVSPITFTGGDIGKLAVHGTVNDLAMAGAQPKVITLGLILEEGLPMETLWQVLNSIKTTADEVGVTVVSGDTKVVDKGKADQLYINTTGIGVVKTETPVAPTSIQAGDAILVSGDLGRHGVAIMAQRQGLAFETAIESDAADLWPVVNALIKNGITPHCLRDCTRGGMVSALYELATSAGLSFSVEEASVPVSASVASVCEVLGLDPFMVACEGRFVAVVEQRHAEQALKVLKQFNPQAAIIGQVNPAGNGSTVVLNTALGVKKPLEPLSGEQLPRIC